MPGIIIRAAAFADMAHHGQHRKFNGRPYISHPIRVAGRVATYPGVTDELVAAAFLHDVVEDCGIELNDLREVFGSSVAYLVEKLTNVPKPKSIPRAERKRMDRERIASIPIDCKIVKLIDRIDNLQELPVGNEFSRMYGEESLLLAEVLRDADEMLYEELVMLARQMIAA